MISINRADEEKQEAAKSARVVMTPKRFDDAVMEGDIEGIRYALAAGFVPAIPSWVRDAAGEGHLAIVQMLWGYVDGAEHASAMIRAAAHANPEVLEWGLTRCCLSAEDARTAYLYALPRANVAALVHDAAALVYDADLERCRQTLQDAGTRPAEAVAWLLEDPEYHPKLWACWHRLPFRDFPAALIDEAYRIYTDWKMSEAAQLRNNAISAPTLVMEWERRQLDGLIPAGETPRVKASRL